MRQPFNTNIPAQLAAVATLADRDYLKRSMEVNRDGLEQLQAGLDKLDISYIPSVCNFVLADMGEPAGDAYEALLRAGIIVRPVANYGLPDHLRISVGLAAENERLLAALESVVAARVN